MAARRLPATRRIDRGSGHSYQVDGEKYDGVTSLLSKGVPKNLAPWGAEEGAKYILENRSAIGVIDDSLLIKQAREAPFKTRDTAAVKGTEVHRLAVQLAAGAEIEVPDALVGYVDGYLGWREAWQPRGEIAERSVINRRHKYAGTFDLWAELGDGNRWLVDYKTGKSGPFAETALQLAAYGNAETMFAPPYGDEQPVPPIDKYGVLWLTPDGWEFFPFDIGPHEFRAFLFSAELARWLTLRANWKDSARYVRGPALERPAARRLEVVT